MIKVESRTLCVLIAPRKTVVSRRISSTCSRRASQWEQCGPTSGTWCGGTWLEGRKDSDGHGAHHSSVSLFSGSAWTQGSRGCSPTASRWSWGEALEVGVWYYVGLLGPGGPVYLWYYENLLGPKGTFAHGLSVIMNSYWARGGPLLMGLWVDLYIVC